MSVRQGSLTPTHTPGPAGRDNRMPCKRSCCWTPLICARNRRCDCHTKEYE